MPAEPHPPTAWPLPPPGAEDTPFLRLWHGFLTGRVMVALALLLLMAAGLALNQSTDNWMLALCLGYLVATAMVRVMARHQAPRPHAGLHWLTTIGVDLAVVAALQLLYSGNMNFTPLFALPVLMAAVLGTLTLAMGTTAGLMNHHSGIGQAVALASSTSRQQKGTHTGGLANTHGTDIWFDKLHGVVDGQTRRYRTTRRIDV